MCSGEMQSPSRQGRLEFGCWAIDRPLMWDDDVFIYCAGGRAEKSRDFVDVQRYSVVHDTWVALPPLPEKRSFCSVLAVSTQDLYGAATAAASSSSSAQEQQQQQQMCDHVLVVIGGVCDEERDTLVLVVDTSSSTSVADGSAGLVWRPITRGEAARLGVPQRLKAYRMGVGMANGGAVLVGGTIEWHAVSDPWPSDGLPALPHGARARLRSSGSCCCCC